MHIKNNEVAVIILAAGKGTRMKSDKAKVLHNLLDKPMIMYVVETAVDVAGNNIILVIGHDAENVRAVVATQFDVCFAYQYNQLGTGHAAKCALPYLPKDAKHVVIMCGDVPLIKAETIRQLISRHKADQNDVTVLTIKLEDPTGYGRILVDGQEQVVKIIEESDATGEQKKITTVNAGVYCVRTGFLKASLEKINADNVQKEFYLTDIVKIGSEEEKRIGIFLGKDPDEFKGVNRVQDLIAAQMLLQNRFSEKS